MTPATASVTIVLPAHDEAEYLPDTVRELLDGIRARDLDADLLVVENGSDDDTVPVASALADAHAEVAVRSLPEADYGAALRTGILAARGDIVVTFDVDYFSLSFLDRALVRLTGDDPPQVVVGSKRAPDAEDRRSAARRVVTATFSALLRRGFGLRVTDTHGMKAMRRAPIEPLARACTSGQDLFDTELLIRAERAGLGVVAVGVRVEERRPSRSSIAARVPRTLTGLVRLRRTLGRAPRPSA